MTREKNLCCARKKGKIRFHHGISMAKREKIFLFEIHALFLPFITACVTAMHCCAL
jgi:hypothetical protein